MCQNCDEHNDPVDMEVTPAQALELNSEEVIMMLEEAAGSLGRMQRIVMMYSVAAAGVQLTAMSSALDRINSLFTFIEDLSSSETK